ncbi:P-loop containing nucleoside triphosphate hydrolase protein [Macrolepiota fuliginosa MF-IS2]|uniref:P-loop containing nucleoside triphosphate hydrolase protein n=1 Tax=Macrolepiota fuliginosa MF-IS2 TaxID=1400762 RepID=A0A9P6C9F7_9AGAR|nr:P-loop containing nucleoside triphosphate hydrolase protein [Macrolepiota fuliginosa MF-IS2]
MFRSPENDPLTAALQPPPGETLEEREEREAAEARALEVSNQIDADLKATKHAMKKLKKPTRILVVGQSMSGKTTTIKNFQMAYSQKSWVEERSSWRVVILFNLVQTVNAIVDVLNEETTESVSVGRRSMLSEWHRAMLFRLSPLRRIEKDFKVLLGSDTSGNSKEVHTIRRPNTVAGLRDASNMQQSLAFGGGRADSEFCIWSSSGWKPILDRVRVQPHEKGTQVTRVGRTVLRNCKDDIFKLWIDPVTQDLLRSRYGRFEDSPGFFLDDIDRILSSGYVPTDHDILRARLRTTGVQEYRFNFDRGTGMAKEWVIYDVASVRTSKAAWIPYFPDITALVFLAPLSSFDEKLPGNPTINRLEDTFVLWKTVCSSKLLAGVQLILFMNKTDLLLKKIAQGIQVKDHIPIFDDNTNEFAPTAECFRRLFKKMFRDSNVTTHRKFLAHFTNVVDTRATSSTLRAVQSAILRNEIIEAGLM